ncbi:hypothetical protein AX660_10900 [Paraglaciecola hydrolytica]|uniref:Uncharacterized protein n=1 Tax=Paraglaciecola hydrolytica TaxID=1799789 RepID=A0A136A5I1_9ALTE|nr:hypothetical protein AX660_10900 [Paraglaciecola hydrolytica]
MILGTDITMPYRQWIDKSQRITSIDERENRAIELNGLLALGLMCKNAKITNQWTSNYNDRFERQP